MLQEAAEGGEEALGLATFSTGRSTRRHDPNAGSGVGIGRAVEAAAAAKKSSPIIDEKKKGVGLARVAGGGGLPATTADDDHNDEDQDRDVRELESMLMGLDAEEEEEEDLVNVPVVRLDAAEGADLAAAAAAASVTADKERVSSSSDEAGQAGGVAVAPPPPEAAAMPTQTVSSGSSSSPAGGAAAAAAATAASTLVSEVNPAPRRADSHSPLAFTIEEEDGDRDDDDKVRASSFVADPSSTPLGSPSAAAAAAAAAADLESTRELLGSIAAATLTPSAPGGGDGQTGSNSGNPLGPVTKSELALVHLMEEDHGEPGGPSSSAAAAATAGLLQAPGTNSESLPPRPLGRAHGTDGGVKEGLISQPGRSGFDDALSAAESKAFGSSDTAGVTGGGSSSGGGGDDVPGDSSIANKDELGALHSAGAAGRICRRADPVFSLGHDRWVTCGFTSAHTVGRGKPGEASVGRALRDASSVLALDSVNYFLARWGCRSVLFC